MSSTAARREILNECRSLCPTARNVNSASGSGVDNRSSGRWSWRTPGSLLDVPAFTPAVLAEVLSCARNFALFERRGDVRIAEQVCRLVEIIRGRHDGLLY
jgi:hypothetical protein